MKINEYILFERNVSFFYNYVIQKIIKAYSSNILTITPDLYYRVIFSICRSQNLNLEKMSTMIKNKINNDFKQDLWTAFQSSKEFVKTAKTISVDIVHSNKFHAEIVKKTREVLFAAISKETLPPKLDTLRKFQEILTDKPLLQHDSIFKTIY